MSFQAYIDNIYKKTGKTPEDLKEAAEKARAYSYDMTATDLKNFLKKNLTSAMATPWPSG